MNWIKVEDKLPEEGVNVLAIENSKLKLMALCYVSDDNNNMTWAWCQVYDGLDGEAYFDDEYEVTHWMPLPEHPNN